MLTASNTTALQQFNPFTETPVEGTHWQQGSLYGQATAATSYQVPRTLRMSVGLRF